MSGEPLTPGQRAFYEQITAKAAEVMAEFDYVKWEEPTAETLHAAGLVVGECLRKYGIPCSRVRAYVEDGILVTDIMVVEPRGYG